MGVINWDKLREITDGDPATERQLFKMFDETCERVCTLLASHLDEHAGTWQRLVHELKGAAANMQMASLVHICREMESLHAHDERSKKLAEIMHLRGLLADELLGVKSLR